MTDAERLDDVRRRIDAAVRVVVLTGAGISTDSGIPDFRGPRGVWTRNPAAEKQSTIQNYLAEPEVRRAAWRARVDSPAWAAEPNAGHRALVALEQALGDRFHLVTQNIDGLHRRAGSSEARTSCIHGDAAWVRCAAECGLGRIALPEVGVHDPKAPLSESDRAALRCPRCGGWLRPHVLWFDEYYDEENYRMDTALRAAARADLLLVVGTSGATNLPMQIGELAWRRGIAMVDVNPEENPFSELCERSGRGFFARGTGAQRLPGIVAVLGVEGAASGDTRT
jgi:NAD-dependent deacetylase